MMRTSVVVRLTGWFVAVGLVAGLAPIAGGLTRAQSNRPTTIATLGTQSQTLRVIEHLATVQTIDLGESGDSIGDLLVFSNPVFDETDQHEIGTSRGSCIRTIPGSAWECTLTVTLAGGQLSTEGPYFDKADSTLAVVGGTGRYVGATGEMAVHARDAGPTEVEFTYSLR